jgi:hypothetical protein
MIARRATRVRASIRAHCDATGATAVVMIMGRYGSIRNG